MRGDMENRIKEQRQQQQIDLFADRMSSHYFQTNWFRMLMSTFGYVLIDVLRQIGLKNEKMRKSYCGTIRLQLLKIGAVITRKTRSIKFMMNSNFPLKDLFWRVSQNLSSSPP
jgi:hypothetical protein